MAFLLALNIAGSIGLTHLTPLLLLTASAGIAAVFVQRERRTQAPMIDLGLLRRIDFTAGIAAGLLSYLVLFGVLFVVAFFLEHAQHLSPTRAGIELGGLPVALGPHRHRDGPIRRPDWRARPAVPRGHRYGAAESPSQRPRAWQRVGGRRPRFC